MNGKWFDDGCPVENYHKHTAWSNFTQPDSATSLSDFIKKTKERGGKCLFSTEHGYQGEWLHVYNEAKAAGLKFVYGVEAYWVKDINEIIIEEYIDKKGEKKTREKKDNTNCHMVLIARTYTGIRKLNYIISIAQDEGYYYKQRIDLFNRCPGAATLKCCRRLPQKCEHKTYLIIPKAKYHLKKCKDLISKFKYIHYFSLLLFFFSRSLR